MMSPGLSPAVLDLGLGDMLKEQMSDEEKERRRKMAGAAQPGSPNILGDADPVQMTATQMLFGSLRATAK